MATNLYSLAGQGNAGSGWGVASGIGDALSSAGSAAMMSGNPIAMAVGGGAMAVGTLGKLIMSPFQKAAEEQKGREMYSTAQNKYRSKVAANPLKYSLKGISNIYDKSISAAHTANTQNTEALLDRYSSTQRRLMKSKINSGLTAGASQANQVQNNIAFQQQANKLFQQQAASDASLRLREGQAKWQATDVIDARKDKLARSSLTGAGVTNSAALGGLTDKITGGF